MRFIPDEEIEGDIKNWDLHPDAPIVACYLTEYAIALQALRKKARAYMNEHPKQGCDGAWADMYKEVYGKEPEETE